MTGPHHPASKYAKGYNLENCCQVNLGYGKRGRAEDAPVLWQQSKIGQAMDYALTDIMLEKYLLDLCMAQPILDPGNAGTRIFVRHPQK